MDIYNVGTTGHVNLVVGSLEAGSQSILDWVKSLTALLSGRPLKLLFSVGCVTITG